MTRIYISSFLGLLATIFACKIITSLTVAGNEINSPTNESISTLVGVDFDSHERTSHRALPHNNSKLRQPSSLRNVLPGPSYFCGQLLGGHYMFGSASSYCGGYTIRNCSAQCFNRNFTFFQCEGFLCHCFS